MSTGNGEHWTWELTNVHNHSKLDKNAIETLLQNRGYEHTKNKNRYDMIQILTENYNVEDEKLKPIDTLSIQEIQSELCLRKIDDKHAEKQELVERLKSNQIPSKSNVPTNQIIVYGFVRENVKQKLFYLIPFYLKDIMAAYASSNVIAFCSISNQIHIAQINHDSCVKNSKSKCKIITLNPSTPSTVPPHDTIKLYTSDSAKIPPQITDLMASHVPDHDINAYHELQTIFRIGEPQHHSHQCSLSMVIMSKNYTYNFDEKQIAFEWNLPSLSCMALNSMCYARNYLVAFCGRGREAKLCGLSFKSNDPSDWSWNNFRGNPSLKRRNNTASGVIFKPTKADQEKYFICGGLSRYGKYKGKHKSEIYDFRNNTWTSIKTGPNTMDAGICYDNETQNIYVGGGEFMDWPGTKTGAVVQGFDIEKERWYELPATWMNYGRHPTMWNSLDNHNLLWIASLKQNGMEYIDLREDKGKWRMIRIPRENQGLSDALGLKEREERTALCIVRS